MDMTQTALTAASQRLTRSDLRRLRKVRDRFGVDHDLFEQHQLTRLCFVLWLVRTGRLRP